MSGIHQMVRWLKDKTSSRRNKTKIPKFSAELRPADDDVFPCALNNGLPNPWTPLTPNFSRRRHRSLQKSCGPPPMERGARLRRSLPPVPTDTPERRIQKEEPPSPSTSSTTSENDYEEIWPWDMDPPPGSSGIRLTKPYDIVDIMTGDSVHRDNDASCHNDLESTSPEATRGEAADMMYLYRYSCRLSDSVSIGTDGEVTALCGGCYCADCTSQREDSPFETESADEGFETDCRSSSEGSSYMGSHFSDEGCDSDSNGTDRPRVIYSSSDSRSYGYEDFSSAWLASHRRLPSTGEQETTRYCTEGKSASLSSRPTLGVSGLRFKTLFSPPPMRRDMPQSAPDTVPPSSPALPKRATGIVSRSSSKITQTTTPGFHIRAPTRSQANILDDVSHTWPPSRHGNTDHSSLRINVNNVTNSFGKSTKLDAKSGGFCGKKTHISRHNTMLNHMIRVNHDRPNAAFF